jgi:hypothetical protein
LKIGPDSARVFHEVAVRQHHFLAHELREFRRADLAQAFEERDIPALKLRLWLLK